MPRLAVIDIGTNSVKLLVGDVSGDGVDPVLERSRQTRLGRAFYRTHQLTPDAVALTTETAAAFALEARASGAERIRVIATSAAREARNPETLITAIQAATGLDLDIISGGQEALWAYQGVRTDPRLHGLPLLIVDVGGGSSEIIAGDGPDPLFDKSLAVGCVRLLEQAQPSDPPRPEEWTACRSHINTLLDREIVPDLEPILDGRLRTDWILIGTSGTATVLGMMTLGLTRFDRFALDGLEIPGLRVGEWCDVLWRQPIAERRRIPGLPPERADVILTGLAIYRSVLERFSFPTLRLSMRSLRYAALCGVPALGTSQGG